MSPTSVLAELDVNGKVKKLYPGHPPELEEGKLAVGRIHDLYREVESYGQLDAAYVDKMHHKIPGAPVFDRADYLLKAARGKVVLDIGATGPMAEALQDAAKEYHGTDKIKNPKIVNFWQFDIEQATILPYIPGLELIIAGEVIEHLSNAGRFIDLLYGPGVQVILTTPNAGSAGLRQHLAKGIESVNREHVAWYSYHTLKVLTERHGFRTLLWGWYNGQPYTAEGLIWHMEPIDGND